MSLRWTKVATTDAIAEDDMIAVQVDGRDIAIYHVEGAFHATSNVCTHAFALLTDGFLDDCTIECPLHAARFDVRTGRALEAPATQDLKVYPLRIEGADILIGLD